MCPCRRGYGCRTGLRRRSVTVSVVVCLRILRSRVELDRTLNGQGRRPSGPPSDPVLALSPVPARELFPEWGLLPVVVQLSTGRSWFVRVDLQQRVFRFDRMIYRSPASVSAQVPVLDPVSEVVRRSDRVSNSMCRPHLGPMLHAMALDPNHGRDLFPGRTQIPQPSAMPMQAPLLSRWSARARASRSLPARLSERAQG